MDQENLHTHSSDPEPNGSTRPTLRAITYLAPGIPLAFFEQVTEHLERALGCSITLNSESRSSGPMGVDADPFAEGLVDIGFLCSPSYLYLQSKPEPSIELVPAGFVFRDDRSAGEPVYFSEVVVRANHSARTFTELEGASWGYNDKCSLSGYFAALQKLEELGRDPRFFQRQVMTGSHHASIERILSGAIDVATIDSVALRLMFRERPELRQQLRVVDSLGPFPIQPVVVRSALGPGWAKKIGAALLELDGSLDHPPISAAFELERCAPIDDEAYADEYSALCRLGQISAKTPRCSTPPDDSFVI